MKFHKINLERMNGTTLPH